MDPLTAVPCRRCGAANPPGARFCHQCGLADPAAAPAGVPAAEVVPPAGTGAPASAVPTAAAAAPGAPAGPAAFPLAAVPRKAGRGSVWILLGGLFLLSLIALAVVAIVVAPQPQPPRSCTPKCPRQPVLGSAILGTLKQSSGGSTPLSLQHSYVSSAYHYALQYDTPPSGVSLAGQNDHAIGWQAGNFPYQFSAEPANGQAAQDVVNQLQSNNFPDAQAVYAIPGAEIGYVPGAGTVYDLMAQSGSGQTLHARLIIIAAVQNDLAIELVAIGPYVQSTPKDGHPNPADTPLVDLFDPIVNTVTWPGQPPH